MTDGYQALLERAAAAAPVNVDLFRQRLTGQIGVNPGDRMKFSMALLAQMLQDVTERETLTTAEVILDRVVVEPDGSKVLVLCWARRYVRMPVGVL